MEWREEEGVTTSQLRNQNITHDTFVLIWKKFFQDVFKKVDQDWDHTTKEIWSWDCIVCEVYDFNWQIAILPYDTKQHWADRSRLLIIDLPEYVETIMPLDQDDYIRTHYEDQFITITTSHMDHLIRMMIASFRAYSEELSFWSQPDMSVKMMRFYRFNDQKFATLTANDSVYEDMS